MAFDSIGQAEGQGDGVRSELDKASLESFSFDLNSALEEKPSRNLSPAERGVSGFNTGNATPKIIGALSNLQLEDNGFMSQCVLTANLYHDGNRLQTLRSGMYDREYRSLFPVLPGEDYLQVVNNSVQSQDSQREIFRHSGSMRPDLPVNDLAWILNQRPLTHQASQSFSDQFVNAPETTRLGKSSFYGIQQTVRLPPIRTSLRESYSNMPIHNASEPTAHFGMPSHPDSLFSGIYGPPSLGEGFDIGRMCNQGRSQFQRPEIQMTYHHGNEAAAGLNDFRITSRNSMDLHKAHLFAQLRQSETESYMPNFGYELQHNPSNLITVSMAQAVNGPRGPILLNQGFPPSRNGGRFLLEAMKIDEVYGLRLADIVGHVAEFSMDQWGSGLIQKKLGTTSEEDKNLIFPEISLHARELMTDIFGNYVIQKFLEFGSASQRSELVDQLYGRVLNLSLHMFGCRVVQKALDVVDADQAVKIVAELSGEVIKCVYDQNGNYVIQKCIESIPEDRIQFIITTFYGQVAALSIHPYGSRVMQRVVDYCNDQKTRETVFGEILGNVFMLAQTQYGNYVVQRLVVHGKPHERRGVIKELAAHIVTLSTQKFGSNVIETCLGSCSPQERRLFVNEFLKPCGEIEPLQPLMEDRFGNYVVGKLLNTCSDEELELILSRIKIHLKSLKKNIGNNNVSRMEQLVISAERRLGRKSLYK